MSKTTTPIHKPKPEDKFYWMALMTAGAFALVALLIVGSMLGWPGSRHRAVAAPTATPHGEIGTALEVTPLPSPTPQNQASEAPLRLTLAYPDLTDEQRYWEHTTESIWRLPIAFGVDKPPIKFTDNEAVIFSALIFTECRFMPFRDGAFVVNEIGATGCGQLTGGLLNPETRTNPNENLYAAAAEFRRLIDEEGGDIMSALRDYKGSTTADTTWQANSVWDYVRIGDSK